MAPEGEAPERRPAASRFSIYVGIAFLILIVVATLNTIRTQESGVLGSGDTAEGEPLPEFALVDLRGERDADANIFQDDCESSATPCPPEDRRTPACEVRLSEVIRICDLFDRPLVLSFWFTTPADCPPTQDVVDAAARRYRDRVGFLSIAVRGERSELERIVRERGWSLPVGWDRDGAVSNLLRVGLCPTVAFVLPGGLVADAKVGSEELSAGRLEAGIERLIRAAERRERESR